MSLLCVAAWIVFAGGTNNSNPDGVQIIAPAATPALDVVVTPAATMPVEPASEVSHSQQITVYITGEVINAGVYTVSDGERLDQVLQLAGGPTDNADLTRINLAAYVTDAAHYNIPGPGEPVAPGEVSSDAPPPNAAEGDAPQNCRTPVNVNTATAQCLETLPGIGGVRAASIVAYREQEGPFASPEAITDVSGIGDGIYRRIAELVTVSPR